MGDIYQTETWRRVDPRLQAAFTAMVAAAPGRVSLGNGWRSNDAQRRLYAQKPGLAAPPGKSNHEFGLALDIEYENSAVRRWVHQNAHRFGLWFPMDYEPWHVQLIGVDRHNIGNPGRLLGGGRDAFSMAPDGRFLNPYDAMAGYMDQEDNTDPMTQFGRMVSAITASPDVLSSTPAEVEMMGAPSMEGGGEAPDIGQVAGQLTQDMQMANATDIPLVEPPGEHEH